MNPYLLSCDWGTSSFRLRLVDRTKREILGEIRTTEGNAAVYQAWLNSERPQRVPFYRSYLHDQITQLSFQLEKNLDEVPALVSGMASSSIGMYELPYQEVPFKLENPELNAKKFDSTIDFPNETWVFTGLRTKSDVMRGEEVQLIGLQNQLSITDQPLVFIFPGTHSKHIYVSNKRMLDFQTYMTGEVFQLMSTHSILRTSVQNPSGSLDQVSDHFVLGVKTAAGSPLLHSLFLTRTRQLLHRVEQKENWHFLSGLLIGSELKNLFHQSSAIYLCGGGHLSDLYEAALSALHLPHPITVIPADKVDHAVIYGHLQLAAHFDI